MTFQMFCNALFNSKCALTEHEVYEMESNDQFEIREIREEDFEQFQNPMLGQIHNTDAIPRDQYEINIQYGAESGKQLVVVAIERKSEKLVGIIKGTISIDTENGPQKRVMFDGFAVLKEYQGQGVGIRIFKAIQRVSLLRDVNFFELCCTENVEKFYHKLGYQKAPYFFTFVNPQNLIEKSKDSQYQEDTSQQIEVKTSLQRFDNLFRVLKGTNFEAVNVEVDTFLEKDKLNDL
ncbi:UNKNOWN [Stylonychia lemnae]|uniref:N-acetyltransferase domain-containing protein n=1 Tax=Stylonychia lemnae TaxID=5949 RepID=A0A078AFU1_STYLE|nr:UNKNOWN [Stylonychia lemnae]|eukprot:CDW80357.1 UNKNOWN [Stylonychia lemnae]